MPSKLSQFWRELKRRNVVRVITVYAGAAFVILELVDMVREPFELPNWSFKLVILILSIGFIIAVILSWIYDIHPQGGMVKTEPADKIKSGDIPNSSNSWKIASYISFVVIVGLIVLNIIPRTNNKKEILDKSIAVLPFRNDSPDEEKMYFINGTMEAILDHLCRIEDLRVPGRSSVEQYRDNPKPIPVVAKEMNVSYILEGSGHRDGNNVRLIIQLLDGKKDQHIWSRTYDANIDEIFDLQRDIAEKVATEIKASISPEEQELITKVPTKDLVAFDLYQRGKEEHWNYWLDNADTKALANAKEYYIDALDHDSAFALAYTGLAWIFWDISTRPGQLFNEESYFSENYLDSVIILVNRALSYDPRLSDAYTIKGLYFREIGKPAQAITELEKAIELNPNDWLAYWVKGSLHSWRTPSRISIQDLTNAYFLNRGPQLPMILNDMIIAFYGAGFIEQAYRYNEEKFELQGDSMSYYLTLFILERFQQKYKEANGYAKNAYQINPDDLMAKLRMAWSYQDLNQYDSSIIYYEEYITGMTNSGTVDLNDMNRIGYSYWKIGNQEKANLYFQKQIEICEKAIELGRSYSLSRRAYYDIAGVYAFLGEREKAYEYLRVYNQGTTMTLWDLVLLKTDSMFDSIREEPEFQQIVLDVEAKYQAEHERVRQWLEENEML